MELFIFFAIGFCCGIVALYMVCCAVFKRAMLNLKKQLASLFIDLDIDTLTVRELENVENGENREQR